MSPRICVETKQSYMGISHVPHASSSFYWVTHVLQCLQVVMDEPCTVHYVGILASRDLSFPTAAQVYRYTGLNGLAPDFNGTINVTQAGIPFSSGCLLLLLSADPVLMPASVTTTACLLKPRVRL